MRLSVTNGRNVRVTPYRYITTWAADVSVFLE